MSTNYETEVSVSVRERLPDFFLTGLGQGLIQMEREQIGHILPGLFGYHILQAGCIAGIDYLASTRITHKITLLVHEREHGPSDACVYCTCGSLPIASDSMDVVVLPHLLEFESNTHQVLREVERILIGEGHVVIIGFNPWSLWGLWSVILRWWGEVPWCGRFLGVARIKDWLSLLDFEIVSTEHLFYRPPLQNRKLMDKLVFLERLGRYCCRYLGSVYIIVAKKRVIPLTPMRMQWSARRRMITSGVAEPSARRVMKTDG